MALSPDAKYALIALNRFGFGARAGTASGDMVRAVLDPRGFVKSGLEAKRALIVNPALPDTQTNLAALFLEQEETKRMRERAATAPPISGGPALATGAPALGVSSAPASAVQNSAALNMTAPTMANSAMAAPKAPPPIEQTIFRQEALIRFQQATASESPIVERLVWFWSNHFCVSVAKSQFSRITAGNLEREAIRPHVLGRFADMLKAVEQHPAMLHYLDNQQSVGPNSKAGHNRGKGLNENLAREILELHTLGADGGYSQSDVTALARVITGWTVYGREAKNGAPGTFSFNGNAHEPGIQTILGRSYDDTGLSQGESVLSDLARHNATAHHIALKLARHFVADSPPKSLVDSLAQTFLQSDGDLKAVMLALIDSDEAWTAPPTKMRSPAEFLVAFARATGKVPEDVGQILNNLNALGQPLWQPSGPNGFSDTMDVWASAEGMKLRLDVAANMARQIKDIGNPLDVLDVVCGPTASMETKQAIARAESKQQGFAILLMSPEFQRR